MTEELGSRARALAVPYYDDALPAHDQFHARRVRNLAVALANRVDEPVDRETLAATAWFHDIGRPRERAGEIDDHGAWAATEATDLLATEPVSDDRIEAISHCLRAHSIRPSSPEPETIEAKLLFDADKLDAAGARGLIRLACIVGERSGRTGERYAVIDDASAHGVESIDGPDITLLREWTRERLDALYTDPARSVGQSRWEFMTTFFEQFERELQTRPPTTRN
ncbi:HD domain-containing protein [Halovenus sp. HT40]|uniref:HD domain-containing protein n=1 Tax=Halovenus sp. HT40 TaxID=3126691 RepID=UPI00300F3E50